MTDEQKNFIRLIGRSKDAGDGWRAYSNILKRMTEHQAAQIPNLVEIDTDAQRIRLTEMGKGALLALS